MLRIFENDDTSDLKILIFYLIDADKDGFITAEDIKCFCYEISQNMGLKRVS